jgi:hypothetical protein
VLDIDSTEIPVYGNEEQSAYNGHFESTCYHPLLLFNREGDCLAAKLGSGNVRSADDWEELLLPEIERQQKQGKEVVVRAERGLCQTRNLRGTRRARRELRHPHSGEREPGTGHRRVAAASSGSAQYQALGRVQELSLSSSELEEGPAGGGQSGASPGRAIPTSGLHRHEPEPAQPGSGAVLQQAWDSGAMDQRRQAGGEDDTAELPSVPVE